MKLQFDVGQIGFLMERGVLHYVSPEEYMSGAEPDNIEVPPNITLKVKVESYGEITRDKMLRRHYQTSSYTLDEFRLLAHKLKPVYMNVVTLLEMEDKTPKIEEPPKKRRGRKKKDVSMDK